jgi:hypothetical protein
VGTGRVDRLEPLSEPYMGLTVYDLLGALFANDSPSPVSAHTHKLFVRVCNIIRENRRGGVPKPDER